MTLTPASIPPATGRLSRLAPRWILATIVVAMVYVGGRATVVERPTDAEPTAAETRPTPETGWTSPIDPGGSSDSSLDEGDDDASTPSETLSTDASENGLETVTGSGAAGGSWSMSYPDGWRVNEDPGLISIDSPDRANVAMVATRLFVGPLDDEAAKDLGQLGDRLEDLSVEALEEVEVSGRPAVHAHLRYVAPDGEQSSVSVTWIQDKDSLYLVAGEAPLSDSDLQRVVAGILESFTLTETA